MEKPFYIGYTYNFAHILIEATKYNCYTMVEENKYLLQWV